MLRVALWVLASLPFLIGIALPNPQKKPQVTYFEDGINTTLSAHCGQCHGAQNPSAGLDLTSFSGVLKGGKSGKAVIPGRADDSLLLARILGKGGKPQMPMGFQALRPDKIQMIKDWINSGAKSNGGKFKHWAYEAPKFTGLPQTKGDRWCANPIDNFVLSEMQKKGLTPAPLATKRTLARRLYLDLIGIPPTVEEVNNFLKDAAPNAYEKLVDKLLANPHFGERMARPWLDLARYADSDGYEKDLNRTAWKYRDWVIDAFNRNLPYDKFTIEQLAGDMLPNAKIDQLIATGFNRNSMFNSEGGVDPGEAQFNVGIDRVNTTSTVWLGSTIQCARCHDHKYDPFTQKDYYRLFAVFDNPEVNKVGDYKSGQENWYEPIIDVPSKQQIEQKTSLEAKIANLESKLKAPDNSTKQGFETWLKSSDGESGWVGASVESAKSEAGQTLKIAEDQTVLASGKAPSNDSYTVKLKPAQSKLTGIRLSVLPDPSFPNKGPGRASSGNFILTKATVAVGEKIASIKTARTSFTQEGYDAQKVINGDPTNGWAIFNSYGRRSDLALVFDQPITLSASEILTLTLMFESNQWPEHVIGKFSVATSDQAEPTVVPNSVRQILEDKSKIEANKGVLFAEFIKVYPPTQRDAKDLGEAKAQLATLKSQIPTAMVMKDNPKGQNISKVHIRGEWLQTGDEVAGGVPAILSAKAGATPYNRLQLAQWLVSRENPLTARVQVNRLWEMIFGRGLVATSEDFGTQGMKPTHPELLDWLALRYMNSGWDTKAMLKLIVMSATYQQSSAITARANQVDPENLLLSHSPRFRMEAEAVRDSMLAIGGILSPKIGGPSVYPSQPNAIWDTPYNSEQWMLSQGEDRYRRGIYTFWKRSAAYPSFLAMDATARDICSVRRIRTNTPLQALALLNDEVSMDAAKGLSMEMSKHTGTLEEKLAYGFERCTARVPEKLELERLKMLFKSLQTKSKSDEKAWLLTANSLLNLDETISRT